MKRILSALAALAALAGETAAYAQSSPSPYTSAVRYDAMGRVTGTIAPDPDGTGPLAFAATRTTYNAAGLPTLQEAGELANWQSEAVAPASWTGFTVHSRVEISYDVVYRKVKVVTKGSDGIATAVVQYSYDAAGRLECTAVRMNPAVFGSLPSSACTLGTAGAHGPDRITRNFYDAAGQLLKVQKAVGTDVQIDDVRYEYTLNGKQKAVIDANGNRAEFVYDGHDRRVRWTFPSKTAVGQVDALDYEEYGYDANGNRTSLRKRDGRTIALAYDALNRVTSKTYPGGGARAVHYSYDLRGLQTAARFDSTSGSDAVLSAWDGFGRQSSSTTSMSGVSRTLSYQYDANSNRTRVTHPDGQYFDYHRDGLDRLYYAASSSAPLFYPPYDAAGRVSTLYRLNLAAWAWSFGTSYSYDAISRLSSYGHAFTSGGNVTTTFGYNPASQITTRTRDNDDYRFTGYVNVDRSYARNGLNQYTSAGTATFTYDANGNLTSDGTNGYGYDIENRLVSSTAGAALTYDPSGRLWQTYSPSTGATQFLYDGDALVAEYDGAGSMLKRYVHGPAAGADDPLVEYVGAGVSSPRYLFADHQGSIIAIADANGNRIAVNSYDEYGIPAATNAGRFQYTGQAWIPELGMYHYKARIYSPTLGRFLQTDPIGYDDQMNLYAYVGNDPVNLTDPTGMAGCGSRINGVNNCSGDSYFAYEASRSGATSKEEKAALATRTEAGVDRYWRSRCARGDPTGCAAPNFRSSGTARGLASISRSTLLAALREKHRVKTYNPNNAGEKVNLRFGRVNEEAVRRDYVKIRIDLANAHRSAIDADSNHRLSARQVRIYHEEVFVRNGLSASVYGGNLGDGLLLGPISRGLGALWLCWSGGCDD